MNEDQMSGKTAGQLLHESLCETAVAEFDMPIEAFDTWDQMRESQRKRMETAAAAVETGQVRLAREDRDQLRKQVLDLAAQLLEEAHATPSRSEFEIKQDITVRIRKIAGPPS